MVNYTDTEVLIIGGGLAGCSLAHALHQQNKQFLLFDNPTISQCSMIAAGIVNPINFFRINESWKAAQCLPINIEFYNQVALTLDTKVYHAMDYLKIFTSIDEKTKWKQKQNDDEVGHYIEVKNDTKAIENIETPYGYGKVNGAAWLDTQLYIEATKLYFTKKEAWEIGQLDYTKLEKIAILNPNIKIIFCEGAQIIHNPFFKTCKMKLAKGELLDVKIKDFNTSSILSKGFYLLPKSMDKYTLGATYDWDNNNEQPTEIAKANLIEKWSEISKLPLEVVGHKAGVRPASHDRKPIVGPSAQHANMYCINGLGTKGATYSAMLAEVLVQHIYNNQPIENEIHSQRFGL